jgi:signal transduction histidine kinase
VPVVKVWSESRDPSIRLWIADNGIGIAPEYQSRIFQMFHRLHHDSEYEGTGIGLAIVRKAAERMGGSVGVESTPGQGSRFWLDLQKPPGR